MTDTPFDVDPALYVERVHRPMNGGTQDVFTFANGYKGSVVRGPYTYGGPSGLFEVAVVLNGSCCYDTPITGDVLGYLGPDEVRSTLEAIAALPKPVSA